MTNIDKERADFEAWYRSKYGAIGDYERWKSTEVAYLFVAWQASAARSSAIIKELEEAHERAESTLLRDGYKYIEGCIYWTQHEGKKIAPYVKRIAELEAEVVRLSEALNSSATSLKTISEKSGRDEYLCDVFAVRSYAASRANVAFEAMKGGAL